MYKIIIFSLLSLFIVACIDSNNKNIKNNPSLNDSIDYVNQITLNLRENPNDPELFFQRAEAYQKVNQIQNAINDIEQAIKLDSIEAKYYLKISDLYMLQGKSGKAKKQLEKCETINPKNTETLLKLAQIHFYVQQYVESMKYLNKIQEIDRNISEVYFIKGLIYKENGDTINAVNNLHIAVETNPNYYDAYILLGLFSANNEDTISLDYYRNALKIKPQSFEAHYNMAMFYQDRGMIKSAINKYNEIISDIDSEAYLAYFNLGYINMEVLKDYEKAIDFYQQAIQFKDNYFEAYINIGYCNELMKNYQKAYDNYKTALNLAPNYPLALEGINRVEKFIK